MGWKGVVRSIGAASRAADRDAKRRHRELEKQQKQYNKMLELEQAAYEVDVYENEIELLQSVHKECSDLVDWNKVASTPEPSKPKNLREQEEYAKSREANYSPGFIDRLLKREDKKRTKLANQVLSSIKKDEQNHNEEIKNWEKSCKDWSESVPLAVAVLKGDAASKIAVIEELDPFSEISNLGSSLSFNINESSIVEATIQIHGVDIIPKEVKSLLKSGRLSIKNMPKGTFNEVHQDYVCSCVLRVARELFSILPEKMVFVTAVDKLLCSKTGHADISPILSAAISRDTLESLNISKIDPSDSMSNFIHNMSFKKTKGFEIVEKLDPNNLHST